MFSLLDMIDVSGRATMCFVINEGADLHFHMQFGPLEGGQKLARKYNDIHNYKGVAI